MFNPALIEMYAREQRRDLLLASVAPTSERPRLPSRSLLARLRERRPAVSRATPPQLRPLLRPELPR